MKRYLFILILLTGIPCAAQSKDTLCFPTETVRSLLINAEQGKLLKKHVLVLNDRITILQDMVKNLEQRDTATVGSYEREISVMREQRALFEDQIKTYETLLRRERRKRRLITATGILTTGAALFLSLKK